eukprot:TRINITY_DN7061_c0_g1_i1.p1 TRINITY_DN7061_c0_g1~~TRINITY_DN7061_c0_g1_i1.p1  ORF type:complete len:349 (+),score=106.51 TRINITY_DN7061_c0_g1_i1:338-1384(+)
MDVLVAPFDVHEKNRRMRSIQEKMEEEEEGKAAKKQKVSKDDIAQMKETGVEGDQIIKKLMEGNTSFQEKTKFSQEKYIKKKRKKYYKFIRVVKPSALNICQTYYLNKPQLIQHLREDSLAQILHLANIQSNSIVMVVDNCSGMLVGAIAERLAGHGTIINLYEGPQPSVKLMDLFNLSPEARSIVLHFPLNQIRSVKDAAKQSEDKSQTESNKQEEQDQSDQPAPPVDKFSAARIAIAKQCDSLVICSRYDLGSVFDELYPYLALSRPFAVFSTFAQPLGEIFDVYRRSRNALNMQLNETWTRTYQVLPDRTHPNMNMDAASGYVLSGTKVASEVTPEDAVATTIDA